MGCCCVGVGVDTQCTLGRLVGGLCGADAPCVSVDMKAKTRSLSRWEELPALSGSDRSKRSGVGNVELGEGSPNPVFCPGGGIPRSAGDEAGMRVPTNDAVDPVEVGGVALRDAPQARPQVVLPELDPILADEAREVCPVGVPQLKHTLQGGAVLNVE